MLSSFSAPQTTMCLSLMRAPSERTGRSATIRGVILVHHGTSDGMLACVLDVFTPAAGQTTADLRSAARELRISAEKLKRDLRSASLFRPAIYRRLVGVATELGIKRGFIPSRPL